jgi:glycosyltransferase involved in cell wall biosynthesis
MSSVSTSLGTRSGNRRVGYVSAAPRVSTFPGAAQGGARAHVLGTMSGFAALGWEVVPFIVGDRMPNPVGDVVSENRLSRTWPVRAAADFVRLIMSQVNSRRAWRELSGRVDWVYERLAVLQSLGGQAKRHGTPWILETNGPFFYEAKNERQSIALGWLSRLLETRAYRQCDVVICVTEVLKKIIAEEASVSPSKILVVPNGVDTSAFDPDRTEPRRLLDGFVVGFAGSLIEWQGLRQLLGAVAELRREGVDMTVAVVGDGHERGALAEQANALGLSKAVRFVGRVSSSEVPAYLAGFDVGYSGQLVMKIGAMYHSPLKIYEYLSMRKPVVAAAWDDARSVVHEGQTGFLFDSSDPASLKSALRRAYQARASLDAMGRAARNLMVERHSWTSRVRTMIPELERSLPGRQ